MTTTTQPKFTFEQYLTKQFGIRLTVHQLQNKVYQKQEFRGSQRIISATFPELNLTADQVLRGKL